MTNACILCVNAISVVNVTLERAKTYAHLLKFYSFAGSFTFDCVVVVIYSNDHYAYTNHNCPDAYKKVSFIYSLLGCNIILFQYLGPVLLIAVVIKMIFSLKSTNMYSST